MPSFLAQSLGQTLDNPGKIDPVVRFHCPRGHRCPPPQRADRGAPRAGAKRRTIGQKYSLFSRTRLLGVRREQKPQTAGDRTRLLLPEELRSSLGRRRLNCDPCRPRLELQPVTGSRGDRLVETRIFISYCCCKGKVRSRLFILKLQNPTRVWRIKVRFPMIVGRIIVCSINRHFMTSK